MTMDSLELADDEAHVALYELIADEHQRAQVSQVDVAVAIQEAA